MSDASKAVFLSYASQDAEAARKICESLRGSGVEVWFDADGGLEQGDEWDAKIRKQIKECVLFVPIISANTQSRLEGYFRIEWDLAAERARGIASGVPFILPVVIDDTREPEAFVPDRFRAVQWTKLPGGEVPPDVLQRFLKLWSHRVGAIAHHARQSTSGAYAEEASSVSKPRPAWLLPAIVAVLAIAGVSIWAPWKSGTRKSSVSGSSAAPVSEARQLAARALKLLESTPVPTRTNLDLADELCARAAKLDNTDANVWAAWSQVDTWFVTERQDSSPERKEGAHSKAARAMSLDPKSYEARIAQACYFVLGEGFTTVTAYTDQAEPLLRALLKERPDEPRALHALGQLLRTTGRKGECVQAFNRLALNPNAIWVASAYNAEGWLFFGDGDYERALVAADKSIAACPFYANVALKAGIEMYWRGDLDQANAAMKLMPTADLMADFTISRSVKLAWWSRDPDEMLRKLNLVPRDWLASNNYTGPKGYWVGLAHQMKGNADAARLAWKTSLDQVEDRLTREPASENLLLWKAVLLERLGDSDAAAKANSLARQLRGHEPGDVEVQPLGQSDEAIAKLQSQLPEHGFGVLWASLRLDPELDPLRHDPRFQALLDAAAKDPLLSPYASGALKPPASLASPSAAHTPAPDDKSIAVLPFENMSPDPDNAFFCDGVHEDVITNLAKIRDLRVISRTSVMNFRDSKKPLREIAATLGVARVLEGSVRRAGNRVRITAQLIDAATDEHLWAETYDRNLDDIFAIQGEIAEKIAGALHTSLSTDARESIGRRPTENQQAYDLYLQGRADSIGHDGPIAKFEKAIALDPKFAEAHAALAMECSVAFWDETDPTRAAGYRARALEALARAEQLAPRIAQVRAARANVDYRIERDFARAWDELRSAEKETPGDADVLYSLAFVARRLGRWDDALHYFGRARQVDPALRGVYALNELHTLLLLRRLADAQRLCAEERSSLPEYWAFMTRRLLDPEWLNQIDNGTITADPPLSSGASQLERQIHFRNSYDIAIARRDWAAVERQLAEHATETIPAFQFDIPVSLLRAETAMLAGNPTRAKEFADTAIAYFRGQSWPAHYALWVQLDIAQAEAWSGRGDDAVLTATTVLNQMRREDAFDTALNLPKLGRILIAAGRREEAITVLREMMTSACDMMPSEVRRDPIWSRLATDPRFEEILKNAKPL